MAESTLPRVPRYRVHIVCIWIDWASALHAVHAVQAVQRVTIHSSPSPPCPAWFELDQFILHVSRVGHFPSTTPALFVLVWLFAPCSLLGTLALLFVSCFRITIAAVAFEAQWLWYHFAGPVSANAKAPTTASSCRQLPPPPSQATGWLTLGPFRRGPQAQAQAQVQATGTTTSIAGERRGGGQTSQGRGQASICFICCPLLLTSLCNHNSKSLSLQKRNKIYSQDGRKKA